MERSRRPKRHGRTQTNTPILAPVNEQNIASGAHLQLALSIAAFTVNAQDSDPSPHLRAAREFQIALYRLTPLLSSRRSHSFAVRQSRATVSTETPSTAAVSSTFKPPKNRSSTTRA